MKNLLLFLLPGGSILFALSIMFGIGRPPHSPTVFDGVNIFDNTPYKEQLFKRKHPGECYDETNTYPNGDKIKPFPDYGPCSKNAIKKR